jgi:hypothetical protein
LPAKDGELVAEDEDLQVPGGPAAGQQRKELDGAAQREVGESWQHRVTSVMRLSDGVTVLGDVGLELAAHRPCRSIRTPRAGLVPALKRRGATVIWSCHVGIDTPNHLARTAWAFLRPAVQEADAYVFSRAAYDWEGLPRERLAVIAPCIDTFAPKNQPLESATVNAILRTAGILEDPAAKVEIPGFQRLDGSPGRVVGRAEMIQDQPIPLGAPPLV